MIRPPGLATLIMFGLTWTIAAVPAFAQQHEQAAKPAFLSLGDFTVNLPTDSEDLSYVVVSVTLEVAPAAAMQLKGLEPRLKEAVMRRLLIMAERHVLRPGHTDPLVVKASLLDSITAVQPDSIHDVLITRLLYG